MDHATYVPAVMMLRAKDYPQMGARLTPTMLDMLHGAMGMVTEVTELEVALLNGAGLNTIEELGDLVWFGSLVADSIGHTPQPEDCTRMTDEVLLKYHLHGTTSNILDLLKAHIFYGREIDLKFLQIGLNLVFGAAAEIGRHLGITLDDIRAKNLAKLQARYPNRFEEFRANNRDTEAEMAALKGV